MKDPEATTRRIEMPEHEITTHVEYNLVTGEYQVVLNPDADRLPSRVKLYLPRETSQALVRDLAAQQAEADKRNHAEDPERHTAPADPAAAVEQFLSDQLARDDMSLREIAAEAVKIATGAAAFEPAEDEPDGYEPARLQAEPARFTLAQLEAGCPVCGTEAWGFTNSRDEDEAQGPASCDNGHEWIVTIGGR
jgi:hypothetical protein